MHHTLEYILPIVISDQLVLHVDANRGPRPDGLLVRQIMREGAGCAPGPNLVRLRLGRDAGVTLTVQAKQPGRAILTRPVDVRVDFQEALGSWQQPYERLLDDALDGDARRFAREDMVEQAWRVVTPALQAHAPVCSYASGSWGPAEADQILGSARWHHPSPGTPK